MQPIVYLHCSEWSRVLSDLRIVPLPDLLREEWPCDLPCTL
jgi:hypothetical protein